ncbi:MAG: Hsp20/alpha crystallin family protein [Pseudobdellovibrionaceae bacterium]
MSSIDNSTRANQQTEINDLYAEYERKKKQVVKDNESQISELNEYYNNKKNNLTEQNEAVINHIRTRQNETAEKANVERRRLNENYNSRLQTLQKTMDDTLNTTKEKREKQISDAKETAHQKVAEIENDSETRIEKMRTVSNEEIQKAKQKYNHDLKDITEFSEKRLNREHELNDSRLKGEIERGQIALQKEKEQNNKEYVQVQEKDKEKLTEEQTTQKQKIERLDESSAKTYAQHQKEWTSKEQNISSQYSKRILHNKKAYEDQLKTQGEHFKSIYQKNEDAQRESLGIENEKYEKQLAEVRKNFVRSAEKYTSKEDDPFYKIEDRGSVLQESPNFYILKAFVPEHEKDAVKVSIQNDKAVVSGQRSFKDRVENEDKTFTSSSFQTFREEFPFEKPVITEGMTRERQGDWIVFQIPKGIPRFSRKV